MYVIYMSDQFVKDIETMMHDVSVSMLIVNRLYII